MEIEEKLKEAAQWQPKSEMPLGLEQRALRAHARPPLRPIGITRPRSILLATSMAAALCMFTVLKVGQQPLASPEPVIPAMQKSELPKHPLETASQFVKPKNQSTKIAKQSSKQKFLSSRIKKQIANLAKQSSKQENQSSKRREFAVDTASDSVATGSRVAVEAPLFTPAYYAQPSADGESVSYTPVALSVSDPDVIYSETNSEN